MIDETGNEVPERVGFCQDCGKPLTRETVRTVGSGVFCEPCLEARLGTTAAPYGGAAIPPPPVPGAPYGGSGYSEPFPPVGGGNPSPVLAALLGFIPGVGAMYNGQFAKGIAHIVIFALLQSMARMNDFFGLLVVGWVFYQVFDAHQTAKARREGLPLPDPFGLNNIGHHVGVHFRGNTPGAPPNGSNYPGWTGYTPPVVPPAPTVEPPAQTWAGVPVSPPAAPYSAPAWETPAWTPPAAPAEQDWANTPLPPPVVRNRFPGAAVWLIGFGLVFLVLNIVPEWRFSFHKIFPFFLMALGIGIFIKRMNLSGGVVPVDDEGENYAARAVYALRVPAVLFTIGVLWAVQEFELVSFHTWPVLVIVIGVVLLLERSMASRILPAVPIAGSPDGNVASGEGKGV